MAECREFLQGLIRSRHPLLGGILAFNRKLVSRLRPDVLSPAGRAIAPLIRDERASNRLLRHLPLLAHGGDGPAPSASWLLDFRVSRHRLALLPDETSLRLALWYGLTRHRAEVAALIRREDVLALRAEVGEEGHLFALRRSSLLPGARETAKGAEKEVPRAAPLAERIRHAGFSAIARCLGDAKPALLDALECILPADFAGHVAAVRKSPRATSADAAAADWPLLRTLLFKEIDPAWAPCFS